ncbi:MAG: hypothetical protein QXH27_02015 [Candidatus Micrarchaeia archaeon]
MRAQFSLEFIVSVVLVILLAFLLQLYALGRGMQAEEEAGVLGVRTACEEIAGFAHLAALSNGFRANLTLPALVNGQPYNATIHEELVTIDGNEHCSAPIVARNVTRNGVAPPFQLTAGKTYRVSSSDGVVNFTQVN